MKVQAATALLAGALSLSIASAQGGAATSGLECFPRAVDSPTVVLADMHDGDQKEITFDDKGYGFTIKPHNNTQNWVVRATINKEDCTALVDFNVPNKPSPPPAPILASFAGANQPKSTIRPAALLVFTDPSGKINPDPTFPINAWVGLTGLK